MARAKKYAAAGQAAYAAMGEKEEEDGEGEGKDKEGEESGGEKKGGDSEGEDEEEGSVVDDCGFELEAKPENAAKCFIVFTASSLGNGLMKPGTK